MPIHIDYESEDFAVGGGVQNGSRVLTTSWDDLLRAAVTVGRPNRQYVFRHGTASAYEALFRLSLVRMALEQRGPRGTRLRRTTAAQTLDPSEKGAVNYFLGLVICKLFAERLLDAPWMLHLDVFRPKLNPQLRGRSRPDLVGKTQTGTWVALECKGRASPPDSRAQDRAKEQAERLLSIDGAIPQFHIGGIAHFRKDTLRFWWRDPRPDPREITNPISVSLDETTWRYYYSPVLELVRSNPDYFERMAREPVLMPVEYADVRIGIRPDVFRLALQERWIEAMAHAAGDYEATQGVKYGPDGIAVVAGETWSTPYADELSIG